MGWSLPQGQVLFFLKTGGPCLFLVFCLLCFLSVFKDLKPLQEWWVDMSKGSPNEEIHAQIGLTNRLVSLMRGSSFVPEVHAEWRVIRGVRCVSMGRGACFFTVDLACMLHVWLIALWPWVKIPYPQ